MKSLWESLRRARHIELIAAIVALALLALILTGIGRDAPEAGSDAERRLERLLEKIDGVGRVHVMIADGGAVVVCERLDGLRAELAVRSAVRTLLDIDNDRIQIIGGVGA